MTEHAGRKEPVIEIVDQEKWKAGHEIGGEVVGKYVGRRPRAHDRGIHDYAGTIVADGRAERGRETRGANRQRDGLAWYAAELGEAHEASVRRIQFAQVWND